MTALALILGYIEAIVPINIGVPGIKLGIANLAILLMLEYAGIFRAGAIDILRVLISGMLFASPSAVVYSLCGAISSFIAMALFLKLKFNIVTVSAIGGVFHNIGQIIAAVIVLKNVKIAYFWLPILIISGLLCGLIIGALANIIKNRILRK